MIRAYSPVKSVAVDAEKDESAREEGIRELKVAHVGVF